MPARLKEIYKQYPTTFNPVVRDGKVYGMAISPNLTEGQVMLIRQDWLDSLKLEAPTTIDEFENIISAFTNEDPDGNGKNDTYGFTFSGKDGYNTGWVSDPVMIFSAYGQEAADAVERRERQAGVRIGRGRQQGGAGCCGTGIRRAT